MAALRIVALALCLVAALTPCPAHAGVDFTDEERAFLRAHPRIVVGGEMDWPPMDFVEDGEYKGAAKDYLDEIAARTGLTMDMVTGYTWSELLAMIRRQEIDMLPMMYWSRQRGIEFNLTNPYITVRHYVYMANPQGVNSLGDLHGRSVAVPKDYAHIGYLVTHHPQIRIVEVATTLDAIDAVITGQADAVIENTASISYYEQNLNIVGLIPVFGVSFEANNVHMAVRKDWPVLRDILQKALDDISPETTTDIMARWTGSEARARTFLTDRVQFDRAETRYLQEKVSLTACVNTEAMPFEGHSGGAHVGVSHDILASVSRALTLPVSVRVADSWRAVRDDLLAGRCDVAALAVADADATPGLTYSMPYMVQNLALATRAREAYVDSLGDLGEARLGVVSGYVDVVALHDRHPSLTLHRFDTAELALEALREARVDGVLDYVPSLRHALLDGYDEVAQINGQFPVETHFAIATPSADRQLGNIVNKAVAAISNAERQRAYRKWVAVSTERRTDFTLLLQTLAVVAVALIVLGYRYRELSRHRGEIADKNAELADMNEALARKSDAALHMAYHDQLTGLSNRSKLLIDLEKSLRKCDRRGGQIALLFLDLDRFKFVNDSLGHNIGDELLKRVAVRLGDLLREGDTLCRLGGDEFIVVLEEFSDSYSPSIVARRIIKTLTDPFEIEGNSIEIGTSIGISLYPDDATDIDTLLKYADSAMYAAKDCGRKNYRYYRKELSDAAALRLSIETALGRALSSNSLSLVYQPIVHLGQRRVTGAEALLRWRDPALGTVPPDQFIPIAEEIGIMADIGEWVLANACRALKDFTASGLALECMAVNVSTVEILKGDIAERFDRILRDEGVAGERIEIEITENAMVEGNRGDVDDLERLRQLGLRIAVDDFGTGYSSLSYLNRLPLNVIKIDRSFIQALPESDGDAKITQAIIRLAHSLGYRVVAEGVETEQQLEFVAANGCERAQGYFFSKPVVAEDFPAQAALLDARLQEPPTRRGPLAVAK